MHGIELRMTQLRQNTTLNCKVTKLLLMSKLLCKIVHSGLLGLCNNNKVLIIQYRMVVPKQQGIVEDIKVSTSNGNINLQFQLY